MEIKRRRFLSALTLSPIAVSTPLFAAESQDNPNWDESYDVVIVGSGGAGLAAAAECGQAKVKTLVLEKESVIGGNTRITGGGYNACDPQEQEKLGIQDSPALHAQQTLEAGGFRGNPKLVTILADKAPETLAWLKSKGVEFRPGTYQIYGGLYPRGHATVKPAGLGYIEALQKSAENEGVKFRLQSKVTRLFKDDSSNRVVGLEYIDKRGKHKKVGAKKAVIVATGGFSANSELCSSIDPRLEGLTTTNHPGATGDLLDPMISIGAATIGMDYIQCVPGLVKGDKNRTSFVHKAENFIFVNKDGQRFIPEDANRAVLCEAVLNQRDKICFPIIDQKGMDALPPGQRSNCEKALKAGEAYEAPTLEELAKKMGVPPEELVKTVNEFNEFVKNKKDPKLGRKLLVNTISHPPFYAGRNSMSVHYTMGGVKINEKAQVVGRDGKPIKGLYAAGEVTGGVHGTNRVGGNAVAEIFVFGRIAGQNASAER